MSPSQRNAVFSGMPVTLAGIPVHIMRKDRFTDPFTYPAIRLSVITEGTKVLISTGGPIEHWYDEFHDAQQYYGDFRRARLQLSIECMSSVSGTDAAVLSQLDNIVYDLLQQIRFYGLGLYYPRDYIRVWNIMEAVPQPQYFDEKRHRWVYRKTVDVMLQYSFQMLDPRDNIRAIDWDFAIAPRLEHIDEMPGTIADILLSETHAPAYSLDMILVSDRVSYTMSTILTIGPEREQSQSMDMIISW